MEEIDTIKANELLRTQDGKFYKIISATEKDFLCLEIRKNATKIELLSDLEPIVKHSLNIIDLIEDGDYVNGKKIISTYLDGARHYIKYEYYDGTRIYNEDIKSIVTKEMFNQVKYEV